MDAQDFRSLQEAYLDVYEQEEVLDEITGGKGHPGYKAGSRDLGPMQSGHPADSSKRTMKGGTMSMRHGDHLGDLDDNDDDDDDGLEAGLKDSAKKSRENVRKPLRNMVKTAAKRLNKESYDQQLDEISQKTATRAFAQRATNEFETDQTSKKSDATKSRIEKKFGKKAGAHAERAAHANIFGRKSSSMPKESYDLYDVILSHLIDEGYADTQEAAERIMVNMSEEWRESIVEGDNYDKNRQRAAKRAAERNEARKRGQTGNVPGIGYVSPRPERETYRDAAGVERHTSGARMPQK